MPARVQRRDAWILKHELHCNIVRTSHYPQSPDFLDACDELGLLVLEEIPGWQHIGDLEWQNIAVRNVGEMIRRDWNHPSIVLWGVRINESQDNHDFYTRTNELAHSLDDARQTGGIRYLRDSERLEDVFTINDFGFPLQLPNHPLYLNTEFNGHMFSTKRFDNVTIVAEHVRRHARVHNQLAGDDRYAGGIGWCAFDYNTHANFGSGDHICYHGVSDIFRIPKPAAYFYKSQCDPEEEVVLEAGFFWSDGDKPEAAGTGPCADPLQLRSFEDLCVRPTHAGAGSRSSRISEPEIPAFHHGPGNFLGPMGRFENRRLSQRAARQNAHPFRFRQGRGLKGPGGR